MELLMFLTQKSAFHISDLVTIHHPFETINHDAVIQLIIDYHYEGGNHESFLDIRSGKIISLFPPHVGMG